MRIRRRWIFRLKFFFGQFFFISRTVYDINTSLKHCSEFCFTITVHRSYFFYKTRENVWPFVTPDWEELPEKIWEIHNHRRNIFFLAHLRHRCVGQCGFSAKTITLILDEIIVDNSATIPVFQLAAIGHHRICIRPCFGEISRISVPEENNRTNHRSL